MGIIVQQVRLFVFSGLLTLGAGAQALDELLESPWWLFEGANFTVATNQPESGPDLVGQLELFRAVVLRFTGLEPVRARLPTRAVIFGDHGEFTKVAGVGHVLGFTNTSLRHNRMVSSGGRIDVERSHIMFHEYVHYLLRTSTQESHPSWYDEGLAEYLSTTFEHDGTVTVGTPPVLHRLLLANRDLTIPVSRFVHADHPTNLRPQNKGAFYAMSWALVNYIYADRKGERLEGLNRYLAYLRAGEPREESFRAAFGTSARRFIDRARKVAERRRGVLITYPLEMFEVDESLVSRRMTIDEVAKELTYLAVFNNTDFARRIAEEMLELDPANPHMLTALAVGHQADQEYERGAELAQQALAEAAMREIRDVTLEIDFADLLMVWNGDACPRDADEAPATAKEKREVNQDDEATCRARYLAARDAYRRALQLEPDNPEVRSGLGWCVAKLGGDLDVAAGHLEAALDFQPWSPTLNYRAGVIQKRLGNIDEAIAHLDKAVYWGDTEGVREDAEAALQNLENRG